MENTAENSVSEDHEDPLKRNGLTEEEYILGRLLTIDAWARPKDIQQYWLNYTNLGPNKKKSPKAKAAIEAAMHVTTSGKPISFFTILATLADRGELSAGTQPYLLGIADKVSEMKADVDTYWVDGIDHDSGSELLLGHLKRLAVGPFKAFLEDEAEAKAEGVDDLLFMFDILIREGKLKVRT